MLRLIAIAASLTLGQAPNPEEQDTKDRVSILVERLASAELKERDAAERALAALGPAALPLLPTGEGASAEIAQRLERVRKALQERQARASADASRVSLRGEMKLSAALAALAKQSHNPITDRRREMGASRPDDPLVKLDFDKVPFWEALDDVLDQAHLTTYEFGGERGISVIDRPLGQNDRKENVHYNGPFRIAPLRIEAARDLANTKNSGLRLTLGVAWEPRLRPIAITNALDSVHATGPADQEIVVQGADTTPETPIGDAASGVELPITFELPPREVGEIAKLKGKFAVLVTGESETFRFDKLPTDKNAKPVELHKAGARVALDHVRRNQGVWEAAVRVKFDNAAESLESHRGWIYNNEAVFVDSGGQTIQPGGFEQFLQNPDEVGVKYFFDLEKGPDGMSFIYKTPTSVMKLPVTYELHDLELP